MNYYVEEWHVERDLIILICIMNRVFTGGEGWQQLVIGRVWRHTGHVTPRHQSLSLSATAPSVSATRNRNYSISFQFVRLNSILFDSRPHHHNFRTQPLPFIYLFFIYLLWGFLWNKKKENLFWLYFGCNLSNYRKLICIPLAMLRCDFSGLFIVKLHSILIDIWLVRFLGIFRIMLLYNISIKFV